MGPFKRNLPNILSALRIVLIIPFVLALRHNDNVVVIVSTVSILATDYLDGKLARAWNVTSQTGKILDPLADKICTASAAISLVCLRGFPFWLLILIVLRDIIILMAGLALLSFRDIMSVSDMIGKITMVVIAGCLLIYLFNIKALMSLGTIVTVISLVASIVSYSIKFLGLMWGSVD